MFPEGFHHFSLRKYLSQVGCCPKSDKFRRKGGLNLTYKKIATRHKTDHIYHSILKQWSDDKTNCKKSVLNEALKSEQQIKKESKSPPQSIHSTLGPKLTTKVLAGSDSEEFKKLLETTKKAVKAYNKEHQGENWEWNKAPTYEFNHSIDSEDESPADTKKNKKVVKKS